MINKMMIWNEAQKQAKQDPKLTRAEHFAKAKTIYANMLAISNTEVAKVVLNGEVLPKINKKETKTQTAYRLAKEQQLFTTSSLATVCGSGIVYNAVKKMLEDEGVVFNQSQKSIQKETQRAFNDLYTWSAQEVKSYINKIEKADQTFWAMWKLFKHKGKWSAQLSYSDFAIHFSK